jgi:hypothetical protein
MANHPLACFQKKLRAQLSRQNRQGSDSETERQIIETMRYLPVEQATAAGLFSPLASLEPLYCTGILWKTAQNGVGRVLTGLKVKLTGITGRKDMCLFSRLFLLFRNVAVG